MQTMQMAQRWTERSYVLRVLEKGLQSDFDVVSDMEI